jgi:hypothetical protein
MNKKEELIGMFWALWNWLYLQERRLICLVKGHDPIEAREDFMRDYDRYCDRCFADFNHKSDDWFDYGPTGQWLHRLYVWLVKTDWQWVERLYLWLFDHHLGKMPRWMEY